MMLSRRSFAACFSAFLLVGSHIPALSEQISDQFSPEITIARQAKDNQKSVFSKNWMISAANPHAVEAGARILRGGGNAIDAAIAVQLTLGLVEPQSSGLGGGAFLVYYDAKSGEVTTLDGRETAPAAATPELFQDENGNPLKFFDAVVGGRSVGTPGTPALLWDMSQRWGQRNWSSLFEYSINLASTGFTVSPRLAALLERAKDTLSKQKYASDLFLPDGVPLKAGTKFINNDYAKTLLILRDEGVKPFYQGALAESIVATVGGFSSNPGLLDADDFKSYQVVQRKPVCFSYKGYDVCGMGPPSSGALTVAQTLGVLADKGLDQRKPRAAETLRLIGDASRLGFADRGRYIADSDFVSVPIKGLLDPAYLKGRAKLLNTNNALTEVNPGQPPSDHGFLERADDQSLELPSTSHFSIVDEAGNVVSMTTTIENGFGSRLATNSFLLNNELTDFSFLAEKDGKLIANRVEPGKRPRSSMAPTIVLQNGRPVLAIGSPGGSRIIPYVANALIAWIDWKMGVQEAVSLPHAVNRFGTYDLEQGTTAETLAPALERLGYKTSVRSLNSGLHAIAITPDGLEGGADPRREGIAYGE